MSGTPTGWIDVSVPVRTGMVTWPGDPAVRIETRQSLAHGDPATVSQLAMGSHTGTHMDAPAHFLRDGATLDALPPDAVIGRARVLDLRGQARVTAASLEPQDVQSGERILLRTDNSASAWWRNEFEEDFVHLDESAAHHLAGRRVRCVGIDYLSVSGYRDDPAPVHRTLLRAGIWIIEGVDLSSVAPGAYELVCVPLKLAGADGAPARAFVRPWRGKG